MRETIHIALCLNDSFRVPASVVIVSAIRATRDADVCVHVLSTSMSERTEAYLRKASLSFGAKSFEAIRTDLSEFEGIRLLNPLISIDTYLRFLIADRFPTLEKAIYLDSDLLVTKSLLAMWRTEFHGNVVCGVHEPEMKRFSHLDAIGLSRDDVYVNAGVLLLDLSAFRRLGLKERCLGTARRLWPKLPMLDQDVLNSVLKHQIGTLDVIWNVRTAVYVREPRCRTLAAIHHFTGPQKPWQGVSSKRDLRWRISRARLAWRIDRDFIPALGLPFLFLKWVFSVLKARVCKSE